MTRHYVIVGNGPAGVTAAETVRRHDTGAEITIVGDEAVSFYSRPGLAYLLTGTIPEKALFSRPDREYVRLGLHRSVGRVTAIDPGAHRVDLADGAMLAYDRLLLAVGAAAAYAFMNVYGQKLTLEHAPMVITTVTATVSTLTILVVLPPRHWFAPHYSPVQWLFVAASGLLSTVLPMNLMYLGIRRIGAFHASVVSIVELPGILVLAYLILNERMTLPQMLGGVLILLSVALIRPSGASGV